MVRTSQTPAVTLTDVHFRFGANPVLRGLNLTVAKGETHALLGRNGAGKTTAIRAMMGLLRVDSGTVEILGHDPTSEPLAVRESVGYLAEDQQMFGWMKVAELVQFVATFYRNWDMTLANQYLSEFDLPVDQPVKQLSKGQNVRLGLVLALAHRPALVILDDPALGLDPIMRQEFNRDLITYLQGEGSTVLYSSHLLYEVEAVADRVAILKDGRIIKQAATEDLRRDVKQLIMSHETFEDIRDKLTVLDVDRNVGEVGVTIEAAEATIAQITTTGKSFRPIALNLDEIFAAYVNGNPDQHRDVIAPAA